MAQATLHRVHGCAFNRRVSFMGGILCILIFAKIISEDLVLFFDAVILFIFYKIIESMLQDIIEKMTNSSSVYFDTPYYLIPWGLAILIISISSLILQYFHEIKQGDLYLTYTSSFISSMIIFTFATSLKCFLIGGKIVSFKYIRRGFFGVFQRFFILLRGIISSYSWFCYFCNIWPVPRIVSFIYSPKTVGFYFYIVMKCVILMYLLWDFAFSIQNYRANSIVAVTPASAEKVLYDCIICLNAPTEPVELSCHHIFCYECAMRWLSLHPTCPMCVQPIAEQKYIEFSNGYVPISALLSVF